jgi:YVTN family beta-propeller protein
MILSKKVFINRWRFCKMIFKKTLCGILYALCLFFVLVGCQGKFLQLKPVLTEEGEVFLYIQPFPQEADRLRFTIDEISAISSDGKEYPISFNLHELKGREMKRQRLLGSVRLPPGTYLGLTLKVTKAFLRGEEGEAALLVPEAPERMNFHFNVIRTKAYLISMTFKYAESISRGFNFNPVFSLSIPAKPINELVGYVTNYDSNNITVFDKSSGQAVAVIATGRRPAGMALDQTRRRAYVAISGDDTIDFIDVTQGDIINRIRLNTGDRPQEIALTPDGNTLLSVNTGSNKVSFINPISLLELSRIDVGNGPNSVLIDSTGRRAFVFNYLSSTISVIDVPNKAIITTISTDPGPLRGQFNRRGDRLYVIHELSSYLTVIDPASLTVLRRFSVRLGMNSIKVDTKTDLVYLGRKNDIVVEAYDPNSFVPVDSIRTGGNITYMTIDGEVNNLHFLSSEKKTLMIARLVSKKVITEMDVGESPYWVTMMGER